MGFDCGSSKVNVIKDYSEYKGQDDTIPGNADESDIKNSQLECLQID